MGKFWRWFIEQFWSAGEPVDLAPAAGKAAEPVPPAAKTPGKGAAKGAGKPAAQQPAQTGEVQT